MKVIRDDIVIDIETLGTKENAVIVSIGALIFNRSDAPGTFKAEFDIRVDIDDQPGRIIEPGTVKFWMKPGMEEARKMAFNGPKGIRLGLALKQLDDFIKEHKPNEAWACSPSFDMSILQNAYRAHRQEFPIMFWKWSCVRTMENFFYGKNTRKAGGINDLGGVAHDALDDCKMEALVLQKIHSASRMVKMD